MTPDQVMADARLWLRIDLRQHSGRVAVRKMLRTHIAALVDLVQAHNDKTQVVCSEAPICIGAEAWNLAEVMGQSMTGHDKMMANVLILELADAWAELSDMGVRALDTSNRLRHADAMIADLSQRLKACEDLAGDARPYTTEDEA